jgi:hypothetical protein
MTALLAPAKQTEMMMIDVTDLTTHRTASSVAVKTGGAAA